MLRYFLCIAIGIIIFIQLNRYNRFSIGANLSDWYIAKYIGVDGTDKYESIQFNNEDEFLARLRELRAFYLFGYDQRRNKVVISDIRLPHFISGETRRPPHQNRFELSTQRLDKKILCIRRILNMINDSKNGFVNSDTAQEYIDATNIDSDNLFPDFEYNQDTECSRNECGSS